MKKKIFGISLIVLLILIGSAFFLRADITQPAPTSTPFFKFNNLNPLKPSQPAYLQGNMQFEMFQDVRFMDLRLSNDTLNTVRMESLTFDQMTVWGHNNLTLAEETLTLGMNPGLGVNGLHEQGITGEGVNVAIIDQPLGKHHPEYIGKIAGYFDAGTETPADESSMHGPAVTSLLVGNRIGTAPGAHVYFAAVPSWKADAQYYADALLWIIAENETLPQGEKIRVVSVSAAPSGEGTPFTQNNKSWDEAVKLATDAGILVLDCTHERHVFNPCYYDLHDPDNPQTCEPGWPVDTGSHLNKKLILVPTSRRTVADTYYEGFYGYQYTGIGGSSWAPPYIAGVLAMGWQINPDLSAGELMDLLDNTATIRRDKFKVINPPAFIDAVRATL